MKRLKIFRNTDYDLAGGEGWRCVIIESSKVLAVGPSGGLGFWWPENELDHCWAPDHPTAVRLGLYCLAEAERDRPPV